MRRIFSFVAVLAVGLVGCSPDSQAPTAARRDPVPSVAPATSRRPAPAPTTTTTRPAGRPSPERRMRLAKTIHGNISPKSVVASGSGHMIAQNMMYRHSITVYDRSYRLVKTIADRVDLEALGGPAVGGPVRGAPVEAAFSPDARYAYVSNNSMYGPRHTREGSDRCSPASAIDRSFVYRLDMGRLAVDRVGQVGQVPKYVAGTPDRRLVLVSNWCSYDLSVLSSRTLKELRRVRLGPYPRGIAVDPRSHTAYVAVMGSTRIAVVNLRRFTVGWICPRDRVLFIRTLMRRSSEFIQTCRDGFDQPCIRHGDTGLPRNLARCIFELAAKDPSHDGCCRIGISSQGDGVLHGGRQAVGFSRDIQNARRLARAGPPQLGRPFPGHAPLQAPARVPPGGADGFHPRVHFRVTPPGPGSPSLPGEPTANHRGRNGPGHMRVQEEDSLRATTRWARKAAAWPTLVLDAAAVGILRARMRADLEAVLAGWRRDPHTPRGGRAP